MTDLYRYYDENDDLLYVGISINTMLRLSQHRCASPWYGQAVRVTIEKFDTRTAAIDAERRAIKEESPKHNIQHQKTDDEIESKPSALEKANTVDGRNLLKRIVHYKPLYKLSEASEIIFGSQNNARLKSKIESGEVSAILVREKLQTIPIGKNKGEKRMRRDYVMTGWQVIEFIEALESGQAKYH